MVGLGPEAPPTAYMAMPDAVLGESSHPDALEPKLDMEDALRVLLSGLPTGANVPDGAARRSSDRWAAAGRVRVVVTWEVPSEGGREGKKRRERTVRRFDTETDDLAKRATPPGNAPATAPPAGCWLLIYAGGDWWIMPDVI